MCFAVFAYRGEALKGTLIAICFGTVIIIFGPRGYSRKIDSLLYVISGLIVVSIILVFPVAPQPIATAFLVGAGFTFMAFFRLLWRVPGAAPKNCAEQGEPPKL